MLYNRKEEKRQEKKRKEKKRKEKKRKEKERKGKERKGKERKGKERNGKERKGKERKEKKRKEKGGAKKISVSMVAVQVSTLEFSRDRKMMSVLAQGPNNQDVVFVKGAPESVLDRCSHVSLHSLFCSCQGILALYIAAFRPLVKSAKFSLMSVHPDAVQNFVLEADDGVRKRRFDMTIWHLLENSKRLRCIGFPVWGTAFWAMSNRVKLACPEAQCASACIAGDE